MEKTCKCGKVLIYARNLAEASHTGCALTGDRHEFDTCPQRIVLLKQARVVIDRMKETHEAPSS